MRAVTTSVRFSSAFLTAASMSTGMGSALGRSAGMICVPHIAGSFAGKIACFRLSWAWASVFSAVITSTSRLATSDCALTTSSGAIVPTLTRISFSFSSFFASSRFWRAASRLSKA